MNNKVIYILSALFLTLLLVSMFPALKEFLPKNTPFINPKSGEINVLETAVFTNDNVSKFVVTKKNVEDMTFEKKNNIWKVNDFNVSKDQIDNFFSGLSEITVREMVSQNKDLHKNFSVDDEEGYFLNISNGKDTKTYVIGNVGQYPNSFYIKQNTSNKVYLAEGNLRSMVSQTVMEWRDKTIVNISKDSIQKIEIQSPAENFTIEKGADSNWILKINGTEKTLEPAKLDNFFSNISPLTASRFLSNEDAELYKTYYGKTKLLVYGSDAQLLSDMEFYKKDDTTWWVKAEGTDYYFEIPDYIASQILPEFASL